MTTQRFCEGSLRHYEVVSGERCAVTPVTDYGEGPLEYWREWTVVLAPNARNAIAQAISSDDANWREYVRESRRHAVNPFVGCRATIAVCNHGTCWGCEDDPACCHADASLIEALEGDEG